MIVTTPQVCRENQRTSKVKIENEKPIKYLPPVTKSILYCYSSLYFTSAGIRCLHLLCHHINLHNVPAYIILIGEENNHKENTTEPDYLTPILTQRSARYHFEKGMTPITVYPEIVAGNPYASPCTVRYILNFPGLLGGDEQYNAEELCFSYSKTLAEKQAILEIYSLYLLLTLVFFMLQKIIILDLDHAFMRLNINASIMVTSMKSQIIVSK